MIQKSLCCTTTGGCYQDGPILNKVIKTITSFTIRGLLQELSWLTSAFDDSNKKRTYSGSVPECRDVNTRIVSPIGARYQLCFTEVPSGHTQGGHSPFWVCLWSDQCWVRHVPFLAGSQQRLKQLTVQLHRDHKMLGGDDDGIPLTRPREQSFEALGEEEMSPRLSLETEKGMMEVQLDESGTLKFNESEEGGTCASMYRHARHGAQDLFAAGVVFWKCIGNFESLVAILSAVSATFFFNFYDFGDQYFAAKLSWTFVSLAVVFPLTYEINQAFIRREHALDLFAQFKSVVVCIYMAHAHWNWDGTAGRTRLAPDHSDKVLRDLKEMITVLGSYLSLPTVTRARHSYTADGKAERSLQIPIQRQLFTRLYSLVRRLSYAVEVMKEKNLPPNEASRINQYHSFLVRDIEKLHNIKEYRTPQGTRSFARVFIVLMPWLYGPYFVWVTHSQEDAETGFLFALVLCVFTSMAMVGLYSVQKAMQDPFVEDGLDDIKVSVMCRELRHALAIVNPHHPLGTPLEEMDEVAADDSVLDKTMNQLRSSSEICAP